MRFSVEMAGYGDTARLARGKEYADSGRVSESTICRGSVRASVAGHSKPWYDVVVHFKAFDEADAERLLEAPRLHPFLLSRIEAGVNGGAPAPCPRVVIFLPSLRVRIMWD